MSVATSFARSMETRFDLVAQVVHDKGYAPILTLVAHCLLAFLLRDVHAFLALSVGAMGVALFGGMTAWGIVRQERFGAAIRLEGYAGLVLLLAYRAGLVPGLHIFLVAFALTFAYAATSEVFEWLEGTGIRAYAYAVLIGVLPPSAVLFNAYGYGIPSVTAIAFWCSVTVVGALTFRYFLVERGMNEAHL